MDLKKMVLGEMIVAKAKESWLDKKVKNPKTGNTVKVRSLDPKDRAKYKPKEDKSKTRKKSDNKKPKDLSKYDNKLRSKLAKSSKKLSDDIYTKLDWDQRKQFSKIDEIANNMDPDSSTSLRDRSLNEEEAKTALKQLDKVKKVVKVSPALEEGLKKYIDHVSYKKKDKKAFMEKTLKEIEPPKGFKVSVTPKEKKRAPYDEDGTATYTNEKGDIKLEVRYGSKYNPETGKFEFGASGTTSYKPEGKDHFLDFDRPGLEESFYLGDGVYGADENDLSVKGMSEALTEEVERAKKAIDADKEYVSLPDFGWRMKQEGIDSLKQKLKEGKGHSFYPQGMGTGKRLTTKSGKYAKPAPEKLKKFLGIKDLFIEDFDAD